MADNKWNQILQALALVSQIGILMITSIGLGFAGGYFLDQFLGREIIFKALGLLLGIFSGFYTNYKIIMGFISDQN